MRTPRAYISLKEKLASALCQMLRWNWETDEYERIIPYNDAKLMTADQVISLFQFHHGIYHAHEGPDKHWNLTPKLIKEHRELTSKVDRPAIDKSRRLTEAQEEFRRKVLAKPCGHKYERRGKIKSRGFQKRKQA